MNTCGNVDCIFINAKSDYGVEYRVADYCKTGWWKRYRVRAASGVCWWNVIRSVYGVPSLPHKSRTTCSLEVIMRGSRDILHVNSESLHLKLGVKIPFPPIGKLNHLQGDRYITSPRSTSSIFGSVVLPQNERPGSYVWKMGLTVALVSIYFTYSLVNFTDVSYLFY